MTTELQAHCNECGEEVMFDAFVYANGEVANVFDTAFCPECETEIKYRYTTKEVEL